MLILATYNIKGGVGKTAAAVNLSYLAARGGARVLVWDLDPQAAATFYFRVKPKVKGGGRKLIEGKRDPAGRIKGTDFERLDLLPADFSYRHMDIVLDDAKKPTKRLRKLLKPLGREYDVVFLDCPPSISLVSEAVFQAADALVVPLIPTTLSLRTLEQLDAFRKDAGLDGVRLLPFFSMVDRRKRLHRDLMATLRAERGDILAADIPYASEVEQMGLHRQPLPHYAAGSRCGRAYGALWDEVAQRLGFAGANGEEV